MSITSVVNDLVTSVSVINALKPLPPTISGYSVGGVDDTALDPAGGQTVQINGTGFLAGATITFDGSAVAVVTYVSPNRLTFTSPAKSAGTYTIYAVNPDGGTAIFIPGIIYSVLPTWTTSAGTLGSYYETQSISNTVVASGDAPITYSLFSGSLPTGSTLYANGVITGTAPVDSSSTTYSFTIQATDAQLQDSTRSFSLTINVDAVTWVSPANNTTYTSAVDSAIANVTLSATDAAGYAVSYSANALPTGLSLSGANISGTPTVIADSSTLLTATAATTNRSATRTINWSITVANDPFFEYNTLLIPGASTTFVDDASTNNFAVSIFGDTKPNNFNPYTPGYYSNYFDGTGDYLTVPVSTALALSANYTIECWIYPTVAGQKGIYTSIDNTGDPWQGVGFEIYTNNCPRAIGWSGGSSSMDIVHQTSVVLNTWNHIALCRNNNLTYLYLNGVQSTSSSADSTSYAQSGSTIGQQYPGSSQPFTGYISNLRVVKGTAVYTAAFTPPTSPLTAIANTSLLTCQSNMIIDNSTNAFTLTVGGDTSVKSFDPFVPNSSYSTYGSGYFDGTGDYLSVADNSAFALSNSNFTMEAWIYPTATGNYPTIAAQYGSGIDSSFFWSLGPTANPRDVYFIAYLNGNTVTAQASNVVVLNTWSHHAVVRNSGTLTYYINGVSVATASIGSSSLIDSTRLFTIGNSGESVYTSYPFTGYITDVRVVNGTAVYTTTFTPPSAPLTAIANTSLLVLQNNQSVNNSVFLDNSTNNFLVTRAGNATQGTFSPYGGNWSNYFDGTDYLSLADNANLNPSTQDFVMEAWVFLTGTTGNNQGINGKGTAGTDGYTLFVTNALVLSFIWNGTGGATITGGTLVLNTWNHVAVVRNSSVIRLYLNGVGAGSSTACTTDITSTATKFVGQARGGNPILGYMSNYRMTKGSLPSGYNATSSTLTVPTAPLTAISGTSLLTCADNRLIDDSMNNFTITKNGDISVQRFSPFNPSSVTPTSYSGYFDGTGDYLSTPSTSNLSFGSGDFTIECWVYANTLGSYNAVFAQWPDNGGTTNNSYVLEAVSPDMVFYWASGSTLYGPATLGTIVTGQWTHYAICRSGNTLYPFKNGVLGTTTSITQTLNSPASAVTVGGQVAGGGGWNGFISNLRIVKGTAVYTSNFTPSTTPLTAVSGTSLLTLQSPTFIDNSTNNFAITAFGNSQPTIQNPFGYTSATTNGYTPSTIGGSGYFDGTGDYLTMSTNSVFSLSGAFTFETWLYPTAFSNYKGIWSNTNTINSTGLHVGLNAAGNIFIYSNSSFVVTSSNAMTLNTWNHVAVVRNSGVVYIYINGVVSTNSWTTSTAFTNAACVIGTNPGPGIEYYFGYLSDARLLNGTALYKSNFVSPIAPLTAIQNTSLLTNMTSAGVYDAAMMNNIETIGTAVLDTSINKFSGSNSMSFPSASSNGAYMKFKTPQPFLFGTGAFTVEMWVRETVVGSYALYISDWSSSTGRSSWGFGRTSALFSSSELNFFAGTTYTSLRTPWTPTANVWYHVAVCRSGSSLRFFVDGTQLGTTFTYADAIDNTYGSGSFYINNSNNAGGWGMQGYINNLRVTSGYARYTSNFTPPTSAFPIY